MRTRLLLVMVGCRLFQPYSSLPTEPHHGDTSGVKPLWYCPEKGIAVAGVGEDPQGIVDDMRHVINGEKFHPD